MPPAEPLSLALPRGWPEHLHSALIHAVGLARFAVLHVRGWAANSPLLRARLQGENERLRSEVALLQRELDIKDARMGRIPPVCRPHYAPHERLAILTLRAARGWSTAMTARRFLVVDATVRLWTRRCDEQGPEGLLRVPVPVNRFPEFVTLLVQELKATLPALGKRRISDLLARAGLHLGASTVRRMLDRTTPHKPGKPPSRQPPPAEAPPRSVVARHPGHVWGADLTALPIFGGFWLPWLPWALGASWPFSWWLLVVVDHYSRSIEHVAVFRSKPSAEEVCAALDDAIARATGPPKYLITDQGVQFRQEYRSWCHRRGVKPRFGAVGKHGSIAVVERVIRTIKAEGLRGILVPLRAEDMLAELVLFARWYNAFRPHGRFHGATPAEVRAEATPAPELPRFETRAAYPVTCRLRAPRGAALELDMSFFEGRDHLPVVALKRVA